MVFAKKTIYKSLIFAYLVVFPFGQLLRTSIDFFGKNVRLHPADLIVFATLVVSFFGKIKRPKIAGWIDGFLITSLFSLLFSLIFFEPNEITLGGFYLLRTFAYIWLFFLSWDVLKSDRSLSSTLFNSLLLVSFATAIFGWIQYFLYPDLRALEAYGWDDHYFRLVGTFLDPGFTSIILTFGFILSLAKYHKTKNFNHAILALFFLTSVAFTYSRAGYLALIAGILTLVYITGKVRILLGIGILVLLILFLPNPGGEGVNLARTSTVAARVDNYKETLNLIKKSPVFGLGFNNLCIAREKFLGFVSIDSHSCSGTDSSLLFVLATTGVAGFLIFLGFLRVLLKYISKRIYGLAFLASLIAVLVHSLFVNSFFYPWVMGYMALLAAVALKKN